MQSTEEESKSKSTTHNTRREDARNCALFCLYTAREKENTNQERQQRKTTRAKQEKESKRTKMEANTEKKRKTKANTPQAIKPPNHSRTQKPHKPRKASKQYKPTSSKGNPLKTPLKCEIEPYLQATHREQSRKAGKRRGTHHQRTRASVPAGPEASKACPSGHAKRQAADHLQLFTFSHFQKYV